MPHGHRRGRGRHRGRHSPGRHHSRDRHSPGRRHSRDRHSPGRHHSRDRHSPGRHHSRDRHSPGRHHSPGRNSPSRWRPPASGGRYCRPESGRLRPTCVIYRPFRGSFRKPCFRPRIPRLPFGGGGCYFRGRKPKPTVSSTESQSEPDEEPHKEPEDNDVSLEEPEDLCKVVHITSVNLNKESNAVTHHTDKYDGVYDRVDESGEDLAGCLIVRRGQAFTVTLTFNRTFDKESDDIRLVFEIGDNPTPGKGTMVRYRLSDEDFPNEWGAKIESCDENSIVLQVYTPSNCVIGHWDFSVESFLQDEDGSKVFRYEHQEPIYILFNPWCRDDLVYVEEEDLLNEYILNDSGCIFRGNKRQVSLKPWNFGQFEDGILEAAFYIIMKGFNNEFGPALANPIRVSRVISKMVNCNDDDGVLYGRWDGEYTEGRSPSSWGGSVAILEQYIATEEAVKFGQCWVFSGLTTTVCRAIGLPCRSVTNFSSAHDSDANVTIDMYYDDTPDGPVLDRDSADSVWNYHCWNDVWMKRPDLPSEYSGWQTIDATPQEASEGVMCCGPASLHAIKNGQTSLPFDTAFVFAEVNADIVHWVMKENGDYDVMRIDRARVGQKISTKTATGQGVSGSLSFGDSDRNDITSIYKYEDESDLERVSVLSAATVAPRQKSAYYNMPQDVTFTLTDIEDNMIGKDLTIKFDIVNNSDAIRSVKTKLTCAVTSYTGVIDTTVQTEDHDTQLTPGEAHTITMPIHAADYMERLLEQACLKVFAVCSVAETGQKFADYDDVRLRIPDLTLEIDNQIDINSVLDVRASFTNPLNVPLTNCTLIVEGPGLERPKEIKQNDVAPNSQWNISLPLTPKRVGCRYLVLTFHCTELQDVTGIQSIVVN